VQPLRSPPEVQLLSDGDEVTQLPQFHVPARPFIVLSRSPAHHRSPPHATSPSVLRQAWWVVRSRRVSTVSSPRLCLWPRTVTRPTWSKPKRRVCRIVMGPGLGVWFRRRWAGR
jgi:hypothetical protein